MKEAWRFRNEFGRYKNKSARVLKCECQLVLPLQRIICFEVPNLCLIICFGDKKTTDYRRHNVTCSFPIIKFAICTIFLSDLQKIRFEN